MKKSAACPILLFLAILYSCNQNPAGTAGSNASPPQCYVSSSGADSASLMLKPQSGRIEGNISFYFAEKDDLTGKIAGNFAGDTLFVDYTFRAGSKQEYFQNPLVFLKKDGKLYQGSGELTSSYGRTHFDKKAPIHFNEGFVFELVDCM